MIDAAYKRLCGEMARRGGRYPGKDIPEFYALAEELFTPEEAAIAACMTSKVSSAETLANTLGKPTKDVEAVLEGMCDKSLCMPLTRKEPLLYCRAVCSGNFRIPIRPGEVHRKGPPDRPPHPCLQNSL